MVDKKEEEQVENIDAENMEAWQQTISAMQELEHLNCALYHHPQDPAGKAVNFIQQQFGLNGTPLEALRIPICKDCEDALNGNEWILFYCIRCNQSRWVSRKYSHHYYAPDIHIQWLDECPGCKNNA